MICSNCGFANAPGDEFCGSCGKFLPFLEPSEEPTTGEVDGIIIRDHFDDGPPVVPTDRFNCVVCGASNPVGRTFCQKCGNRQDTRATAVPIVPVPPPTPPRVRPAMITAGLATLLVTVAVVAVVVMNSPAPPPGGSPSPASGATPTPSNFAAASGPSPTPSAATPTSTASSSPSPEPTETSSATPASPTATPTDDPTATPSKPPTPVTFDLAIDRHTVSRTTVVQGQIVTFRATITNLGNGIAGKSTTEWFLYGPNLVLARLETGMIGSGLVQVVGFRWNTSSVEPGRYRIRVLADRFNKVKETRSTNNTLYVYVTIRPFVPPTTPPPTDEPTVPPPAP